MTTHLVRRLSATTLALTVWVVLAAGAAQARVAPDDPSTTFVTPTTGVVSPPTDWTREALLASIACLVGAAATVAVQMVLHRGRRSTVAHA